MTTGEARVQRNAVDRRKGRLISFRKHLHDVQTVATIGESLQISPFVTDCIRGIRVGVDLFDIYEGRTTIMLDMF